LMQVRTDLKLQRLMAKKYGEEGFLDGEQRLLQLKQIKKESLQKVRAQLGKLDRTIKAGKRITKEFQMSANLEDKIKKAKEKFKKRTKDRKIGKEQRKIEKGSDIELGVYSEDDSISEGSSSSSSEDDSSEDDHNNKPEAIFKQQLVGGLMETDTGFLTLTTRSPKRPQSKILQNKDAPKFKGYFNLTHLDHEKTGNTSLLI